MVGRHSHWVSRPPWDRQMADEFARALLRPLEKCAQPRFRLVLSSIARNCRKGAIQLGDQFFHRTAFLRDLSFDRFFVTSPSTRGYMRSHRSFLLDFRVARLARKRSSLLNRRQHQIPAHKREGGGVTGVHRHRVSRRPCDRYSSVVKTPIRHAGSVHPRRGTALGVPFRLPHLC